VAYGERDPSMTEGPILLTIVYDNHTFDPRLESAWGFACLVETPQGVVLFDTGGEGQILMGNLEALGYDPRRIKVVVLSHVHADHIGGLDALLEVNPNLTVYLPRSFPQDVIRRIAAQATVVEVDEPCEILPGVHTTGEMGAPIVEQALVVETSAGLVVLTGCAHPGVTQLTRRASEGGPVYLVMGGFHLEGASLDEVQQVIRELRAIGVEKVAPCHCTGEGAIAAFSQAYGSDFIQAGVGTTLSIEW
jgi:7,8-dihydropterin-6-yl-methyl-4-(beta-D-ribofuranosyl)aminobenzene 5'-phosphate synthase